MSQALDAAALDSRIFNDWLLCMRDYVESQSNLKVEFMWIHLERNKSVLEMWIWKVTPDYTGIVAKIDVAEMLEAEKMVTFRPWRSVARKIKKVLKEEAKA